MHSSRMRTVRSSSRLLWGAVCPGGCLPGGVCPGGDVRPGGCLPGGCLSGGGVCPRMGGVCPGDVSQHADLHSKILDAPPGGPNSFNFMQFLGKFGKIVCWHPPWRVGAPSSGKFWIRHWGRHPTPCGQNDRQM